MVTFVFVITKRRNDKYGNPRDLLRVYRMSQIDDALCCIVGKVDVGYRTESQAVVEELQRLNYLPEDCSTNLWALRKDGYANIQEVSPAK